MIDYSISWGYIVSRMESLYGISPDNEEKVAFGDIERRMAYIWQEYFWILYKEEYGVDNTHPLASIYESIPLDNKEDKE